MELFESQPQIHDKLLKCLSLTLNRMLTLKEDLTKLATKTENVNKIRNIRQKVTCRHMEVFNRDCEKTNMTGTEFNNVFHS